MEWKEGWKLSRRLSVDITMESARYGRRVRKRNRGRVPRGKNTWEEAAGWRVEERLEREARDIRDFVCLPVRPSEPEGTSAAASLEEELGRETNTFAEKRRRGKEEREGGRIVRIVR